jgi:1-aminocyclopropane-1-carboxylate deaminase
LAFDLAQSLALQVPSRIDTVHFNYQGTHIRLAVKRDDLIHPLINGNKWRKLAAFVEMAPNATSLVSLGGAYSNHLLAVASLAKALGKSSVGYLRGEEQRTENVYERWLRQLGMELIKLPRDRYRDKTKLYATLVEQHPTALLIPEGGHPLPEFNRLADLLDEQPLDYEHLLVSCGTGATFLALAAGLAERNQQLQLHGVSVISQPDFLAELQAKAQSRYGNSTISPHPEKKRLGKLSPAMLAITKACFEQTGLAPDPIYDAALLLYVYEALNSGKIQRQESCLWLHSGGLPGWSGYSLESKQLFSL